MRQVPIPEPVVAINKISGEPITKGRGPNPADPDDPWDMLRFFLTVMDPDPAMGTGRKADRAKNAIEEELTKARARQRNGEKDIYAPIEDDHWERGKTAINDPKGDFYPPIRRQMIRFQEAWVGADDKLPSKSEPKPDESEPKSEPPPLAAVE